MHTGSRLYFIQTEIIKGFREQCSVVVVVLVIHASMDSIVLEYRSHSTLPDQLPYNRPGKDRAASNSFLDIVSAYLTTLSAMSIK